MSANGKEQTLRLGFLATIEVADHGYIGGLLVTNHEGRPLEYQCTTPVKPNQTQTILYGPTLVPFLLGELIGRTLVEKAGVKPHLILTEQPDILELRNHVNVAVACLAEDDSGSSMAAGPHEQPVEQQVTLGRQRLRFHADHSGDRDVVRTAAASVAAEINLREPFQRVREAMNEVLQTAATR